MAISTYYFLLLFIPYAASSIKFNFEKIGRQNLNKDIRIIGDGASISDEGIQLTPEDLRSNAKWKAGRASYIKELHLWDKTSGELASFTTNFSFVIHHTLHNESYGDGLTFFLAENTSVIYAGGSMGLPLDATSRNPYPLVAVEFDTHWNRDWDPPIFDNASNVEHVGINIMNLTSVTYKNWTINVREGNLCQTGIKYDSVSKNLSVHFTSFLDYNVVHEDELIHTVDLKSVLPEWVVFGFSASTGEFLQTHNVKSWAFSSTDLDKKKNHIALVVGLIAGFTFLILAVTIAYFVWWRKKNSSNVEDLAEMNNAFENCTGPRRFSYVELARATGDFAENEKLGEGGFGGVYKGFLKDSNTYVAVKRVSKTSNQGIKEYASEVMIISRLRHRNLVQLTGWCHEKDELLLVYEFMENGSLNSHLFKAKSLLTWETRHKIAHGLASALLYLHEGWEQCVLHRDIKSSNVMLDSNFNTKLGDFGLAKLVDHDKGSKTLTRPAGTMGYMAPESVLEASKASKETDVYSFGVVALEIACGRKPIDHKAPEMQISLVEWVWELYGTGTLLEAVDPRLGSDFEEEEMKHLMIVGLWCAQPDPKLRPSMRQVIQVLNFEASLPTLPSKMPIATYLAPSMSSVNAFTSSSKDSSKQITPTKASPAAAVTDPHMKTYFSRNKIMDKQGKSLP